MKNKNSQSWCERRCVENCKSCDAFVLRLRRVLKTSYKNLPRRTYKAKKTDGSITTKNGRKDKVPKSGLEGTQGSHLMIFFVKVLARIQIVIVAIACDVRSWTHEMKKKRDEARNKNKRIQKKSKKNCRKSVKKGAKNQNTTKNQSSHTCKTKAKCFYTRVLRMFEKQAKIVFFAML